MNVNKATSKRDLITLFAKKSCDFSSGVTTVKIQ